MIGQPYTTPDTDDLKDAVRHHLTWPTKGDLEDWEVDNLLWDTDRTPETEAELTRLFRTAKVTVEWDD